MNFCDKIKSIREQQHLTQEELANILCVTRQAVSNWENGKNLPDIEMVIRIAKAFNVSLDELILGEDINMEEKLIKDGSDTYRAKYNMISFITGLVLLLIGSACIGIKAVSPEYITDDGTLYENFFLLPIGFSFIMSGVIAFVICAVKNIRYIHGNKESNLSSKPIALLVVSILVLLLFTAVMCMLISANR